MSSHNKDPLEKEDSPSDPGESDSEVDEAEEDLEHLKIAEERPTKETKDDFEKSKPAESPKQEGASTSQVLLRERMSGPSVLHESPHTKLKMKSKIADSTDPVKELKTKGVFENIGTKIDEGESHTSEKNVEAKGIDENLGAGMEEADSDTTDTTSSTSPYIQSSIGGTYLSEREKAPEAGTSRARHRTNAVNADQMLADRCRRSSHRGSRKEFENVGTEMAEGESYTSEKIIEAENIDENVGAIMEEGDSNTMSSTSFTQSRTGVTSSSKQELEKIETEIEGESHTSEKNIAAENIDENVKAGMEEGDSNTKSSTSFNQSRTGVTSSSKQELEKIETEMKEGESHTSEKNIAAENIDENIEAGMEEGNSDAMDTTSSTSYVNLSFKEESSSKEDVGSSKPINFINNPQNVSDSSKSSSHGSASSRRSEYATTSSAGTSWDISDIRTEIFDQSVEEAACLGELELEALEKEEFARNKYPRQSSETSDTNISDLQDDYAHPPTAASSSASTSTSSSETTSKSMEGESISKDQQMQVCVRLSKQEQQRGENRKKKVKDIRRRVLERRLTVEKGGEFCHVDSSQSEHGSSEGPNESSPAEGAIADRPRRKNKQGAEKMVTSKSCPAIKPSSETPEPKSSSSDELYREESPELKSFSEVEGVSKSEGVRRKDPKHLSKLQYATISSLDSDVTEEEHQISPLKEQDSILMEAKTLPETMEISPKKCGESAVESANPPESSYQVSGSGVEGKDGEQSTENVVFERSVGKSKREHKLSTSPQSDEKPDPSSPKAAKSRPKKKSRPDKMPVQTRKTRHDVGDTSPKVSSLDILQSNSSSNESSEDEERTKF